MKTKLTLLFLLTSLLNFSQDFASLKADAQKVYDLTIEKKYDKVLDYTYPKIFEIVPRKDMLDVLNNMLDNEEMTITIEKVSPNFTFSEVIKINTASYYILEHNNKMTMKFKKELGETKDMIVEYLKESMPSYKISIDPKTEVITVDGKAKIIAISNELTNGTWKFLNYNGESPMMEQVLGTAVLEKLGL